MDVRGALKDLQKRLTNMAARAVLKLVDDAAKMQRVQLELLPGEIRDGIERVQEYGFTSVPQAGAEAVVLFVDGRRDHGLVIAVDDRRYRLTGLEAGEVAIYTDEGDKVVIKRGGEIEVSASSRIILNAPDVRLAGDSEKAMKGNTHTVALNVLLTALDTYILAIKPIADPANAATGPMTGAIATFKGGIGNSLSQKVTLS